MKRIDDSPKRGSLDRRTVLRGMGVAVALPWLEAMSGTAGAVAKAASSLGSGAAGLGPNGAPLRMAFVFTPNGVNYDHWKPVGGALSPTLEPLKAVREHVNILTGLTLDKARANGDGPGDHARSAATFLTGRQARKTAGNDIQIGVSVDQIAAQEIGERTRLPSMELGCEYGRRAGNCDSGYACAYSANIAWRDEDTPVTKVVDPAIAFERMFSRGDRVAQAERYRRRRSVLDFVMDDSKALEARLGASDREKLDEYQTSIRELERRIQRAQDESDKPAEIPEHLAPEGVPGTAQEHQDIMYDMMLLAFRTDATRIGTFMTAVEGTNRTYPEIGVKSGHHHLSHHQGDEHMIDQIRKIDRFHVERFAAFIDRMAQTPEGEGSLLDSCMIMYGAGISDGNRHNHEDLPILMAGGGGGTIDTGRTIEYGRETPLCNLYMTLLDRMGCGVREFGDATGKARL